MNKTARVIVTYGCNRNCPFCCNQFLNEVPQIKSIDEIMEFDEIVITGGEPMLIADKVLDMIHQIKARNFIKPIWLYTARLDVNHFAEKAILHEVNGITYTVHNELLPDDLSILMKLDKYIHDNLDNRFFHHSDRLLIDNRLLDKVNPELFNGNHWSSVKSLQWKTDECPLPENEKLFYYNLAK